MRDTWTFFPAPDPILKRVEELAKDQPEDWIFTDRHGHVIGAGVDEGTESPQQLIDPTEVNTNPQNELQTLEQDNDSALLGENQPDQLPALEMDPDDAITDPVPAVEPAVPALTSEPHVQPPSPAQSTGVQDRPA